MDGEVSHISRDREFVGSLIPQAAPFVMVDKLLAYTPESITSGLTVSETLLFVKNGFFMEPGLIEHMAQTVALHTGYAYHLKNEQAPTGYIGAIKKAVVEALPPVGAELETTVNILYDMMGVTLVSAQVDYQGQCIATGEMKTVLAQ